MNNFARPGKLNYVGVKWEMFSTVCWPNVDQVAPDSLKKFMIIKSSYSRQYSEQLPDWKKYRFSEAIWKYFKRKQSSDYGTNCCL